MSRTAPPRTAPPSGAPPSAVPPRSAPAAGTRPAPRPGAAPAGPFAALRGARKRYGRVVALDGVDLEVRPGEVVALLGPNGAGKTTAVHLLLGLIRPDAGRAELFGGAPGRTAARVRTGAMLQVAGVPENLTVREHLASFRSYYPAPRPLGELVAAAGLEGLERRRYGALSGGQRQRLHLALALAGDPDLLFLDEPTTGLDVASRRALWAQVRAALERGIAVVLTTHYLEEADALADRIVLIDGGRVIARGTPSEVKGLVAATRIRARTRLDPVDLARLPGVSSARRDGGGVEVLAARAEPVVRAMFERDPALSGLEVRSAGLEDAFLALTSREGAR